MNATPDRVSAPAAHLAIRRHPARHSAKGPRTIATCDPSPMAFSARHSCMEHAALHGILPTPLPHPWGVIRDRKKLTADCHNPAVISLHFDVNE